MSNYYAVSTTFVPGAKVRSDEVNIEMEGISAGFDYLPADPNAIKEGKAYRGIESGTGNTYTITMDDTRTAYADGDRVSFKATHSNTSNVLINLDGLGLKALVDPSGNILTAGAIESGRYYEAVYNSGSNHFQLLSQYGTLVSGVITQVGYAQEWATKAEDSLISTEAGGDGSTDYSSLHWAAKAAADAVLTAADVVSTNADVVSTNADAAATAADVVTTNADVVLTNADVTYTEEWAIKAEDSLISVAAGGNGTTDYSALHWAAKASASASAALTSEGLAEGYATAASNSAVATAADLVQTNLDQISCTANALSAAADAASAEAAYDAFDDRYLGSKASDPTLDNDGAALLTGALYWNSVNETMRAYTGTVWQDVGSSTANVTEFTATAGQTTFSGADDNGLTLSYTVGYLQVYLNGILLENTTDYTATNGTSIVLTTGANAGDMLQGFGFGTFDIANHYTKTEIDALDAVNAKTDEANTFTPPINTNIAFNPSGTGKVLINGVDVRDADTLNGAVEDTTAAIDTIAKRTSSGHIFANYFNTAATAATSTASHVYIQTASDGYIRPQTLSLFKSKLLDADSITRTMISTASATGSTTITAGSTNSLNIANLAYHIDFAWNTSTAGTKNNCWLVASTANTTSFPTEGDFALYNSDVASLTSRYRYRYIQASPPYDLGDGDIPLFIQLLINKGTGAVEGMHLAEDPNWAYGGPTNTRPEYYDDAGNAYITQRDRESPALKALRIAAMRGDGVAKAEYLAAQAEAKSNIVLLTQDIKNADMEIVPHIWKDVDYNTHQVVLLDPVSDIVRDWYDLIQADEENITEISELLDDRFNDYFVIDEVMSKSKRKAPTLSPAARFRWKNTP
jgi:hypothetical protein